ncbi:unnamed protein product [Dracunculus medinensis]|uniref:Uncharacterized protein n=1 Tax=Dracunculus medinensis TaxID=318479 RepID=A0A0N4UHZ8_DRAME|nr:unnamed protein product [Dracunculus medinensis]
MVNLMVQLITMIMLGDHLGEMNAKRSLENILRSMDHWPQRRVSEIIIDVSGDPQPRRASHLYSSLQSLLFGERNVRNTNITTTSSASPHTINNISDERVDMVDEVEFFGQFIQFEAWLCTYGQSAIKSRLRLKVKIIFANLQQKNMGSADDDFFEMLSRAQSKRINDQRCDPIILSDLTNRSKNIARQSDSIDTVVKRSSKTRRLSLIFDRVCQAATRRQGQTFFAPRTTSTPRPSMTPHKLLSPISNIVKEGNIAPINATFYSVPDDVDSLDSKAQLCTAQGSFVALSSEFRIPVAPPRRRNRHLDPKRLQSAQMLTQPVQSNISQNRILILDGAEGMLNLIASLQGRRMEEQRAHLNVASDTESLISSVATTEGKDDQISNRLERSRSEDAGVLYDMLIRSQGDRLEEQRSELPTHVPEDISHIVMTMQKGRIETQRAHLNRDHNDNNE